MSRLYVVFICGITIASSVQCASKNQSHQPNGPSEFSRYEQPNQASYLHFIMGKLAELDSQSSLALEHYRYAARFNKGSDYLKMKQAEQLVAMSEVTEAQKLLSDIEMQDDPDFHMLSARVAALEFDMTSSQKHMDQAIQIYSDRGDDLKERETVLMKVALLSDSQRYPDAIRTLKNYIDKSGEDEIAYYFLGKIYSIQGESDNAIKAYKKAIELRPSFTTAAKSLGLQYELAGQTDKAIEVYQRAMISASEDIQLRSKLANLYLVEENYRLALEHLYFLYNLEPSNVQTKLRIALIHFKLADVDEAEKMFLELLKDDSIAHDRIHFYLGALLEQKGEFQEAVSYYQQVVPESPYFIEARLQASFLYNDRMSKTDRAIENLNQSIAKKPYSRELYLALANYYEQLQELPEAIRVLDHATTLLKKDDSLLFVLGTFLDRAGDFEAGISKMRKVLELNPNHAHAMNHIGYVYAERRINMEEAEDLLVRAVQLEPQNAYIIDSLGWLYYQKGEFKKARQLLEKAIEIEPKEAVILEHLADAYTKLGLHDMALKMYKKVVEVSQQLSKDQQEPQDPQANRRVQDKIAALNSESSL